LQKSTDSDVFFRYRQIQAIYCGFKKSFYENVSGFIKIEGFIYAENHVYNLLTIP